MGCQGRPVSTCANIIVIWWKFGNQLIGNGELAIKKINIF
jgi:hypothetical protein